MKEVTKWESYEDAKRRIEAGKEKSMKTTKSGVSNMDAKKTATSIVEERGTEYCYDCGGLQLINIPQMEESEEDEE